MPAYAGKCNWCIAANATYVYCSSNSKCYDRTPTSGACLTQVTDLFSNGCGSDVCTEIIKIEPETTRLDKYRADHGGADPDPTVDADKPYVLGNPYDKDIPANNRCSLTFDCTDEKIGICRLNLTNEAGENMRAYVLYNNTITNEGVIKQEINTFGEIAFRRSSLTLMFVNLDISATPQKLHIRYLNSIVREVKWLILSMAAIITTLLMV